MNEDTFHYLYNPLVLAKPRHTEPVMTKKVPHHKPGWASDRIEWLVNCTIYIFQNIMVIHQNEITMGENRSYKTIQYLQDNTGNP